MRFQYSNPFDSGCASPAIVVQRFIYGTEPPTVSPDEVDILEETLRVEEEEQAQGSLA
jgi:hypothetical protein